MRRATLPYALTMPAQSRRQNVQTPPVPDQQPQQTQLAELQPQGNQGAQANLLSFNREREGRGGRQLKHAPFRVDESAYTRSGLRPEVLKQALTAYDNAYANGDVKRSTLTVVDYSMPSDQKRMWVIDLRTGKVLHHVLVSHGSGSGGRNSTEFSNRDSSHQTSIGVMKTGETYSGKHGYSMRMDGLEEGFNDQVRNRAIVMHSASYVNDERARNKSVGRSWGCLAMDKKVSADVIDTVKNGTLVVSYYPDPKWQQQSEYLKQP